MRSERQNHLKAFVRLHHYPQKRKYTGEPYAVHLVAVAEMAEKHDLEFGYEIGLCHDLLEDTQCTGNELKQALIRFGYDHLDASFIIHGVIDLTDAYTKESAPLMNRAERKKRECDRMAKICENSQSIKYCDLIDNPKSIVEHDKAFAKVYLKEKFDLLQVMDKGNNDLFNLALNHAKSLI